jgi:predicted RNase H-like HicB family nuclease
MITKQTIIYPSVYGVYRWALCALELYFLTSERAKKTFMKFPVVLHKDADSDYGVIIPDVPGCYSAGATVAEAFENTQEALALHYEGLVADGASARH